MCGIVGVISWSETHRVTRADLKRMTDAIAHRGPDGEGFYFNIDPDDLTKPITPERPQIAFGFRRLAVLDPTPRSDQPFVSTDGRYVMVFNGEIYNFRDLKSEISNLKPDYVWRTTGDTEVLMMAFELWEERCVYKLNGMFAFAVWDHREQFLCFARDRMGQKPLYVEERTHSVAFASEAAALSTGAGAGSGDWLPDFMRYGSCGTRHPTSSQVVPSTIQVYSGCPVSEEATYWRSTGVPPVSATQSPPKHGRDAHATTESAVRAGVERAVSCQLVSDVPLGVFLSGGVDSSIIALCARKHVEKLKTFSIAFDDPRYDESSYAREVAKHLGTDHHEFRVTPNVIEDLPMLARVFGEPFADSSAIPTHYLCRETRKHVTVALSGDGGDELFGGYDRYVAMQKATSIPRFLGTMLSPLARPFANGHPKSKLTRAARFVTALGLTPARRFDAFMRIFDDGLISELLGENPRLRRGVVEETFEREFARTNNVVTSALATDRVTYLPNDLLTKVDRCSMLHGLEVRSPFMDHELVELAAQLTEDQLLKGGKKRMLREAFGSELPASVFNRPKMGFAVPIGEWFRGPLRAFLRDHLFAADSFAKEHFKMNVVERLVVEHETEKRDHSQRLYALLMLEMWWKHVVRKDEG